jgi:hypothetical protein
MYVIIWKYSVRPEHRESFIEYYHSEGKWARFFHQATEYFGTDFFQLDDKSQFVTIDKWSNRGAYKQFLDKNHLDYHELDKCCEEFTTHESLLGEYFMFE